MFFDRYEIHIHAFGDFLEIIVIITPSSQSLTKNEALEKKQTRKKERKKERQKKERKQ